jgi:hypothetical protein
MCVTQLVQCADLDLPSALGGQTETPALPGKGGDANNRGQESLDQLPGGI